MSPKNKMYVCLQFAMVDVVSSAFIDEFASLRKRRTLVTLIVCIVSFVCGLPLCMQGGIYVFTVLNDYAAGYCIIVLAFIELAIVSYCYGVRRFISDCQMMVGHQGYAYWSYWMIAWSVVAPAFLLVSLDKRSINARRFSFIVRLRGNSGSI